MIIPSPYNDLNLYEPDPAVIGLISSFENKKGVSVWIRLLKS